MKNIIQTTIFLCLLTLAAAAMPAQQPIMAPIINYLLQDSEPTPTGEPSALSGITAAHNSVRAAHGVADISWDDELAEVAQAWANNCEWAHNSNRSDNYPGYVGENIYGATFIPNGPAVTNSWASEEQYYDYNSNTCSDICGHYTQIVWATSTKLGCGIANCPNLSYPNFVVCNYSPGGNYNGQRPY